MKITFKETPEQLELIAAMGSKNPLEARAAQETFAELLAPTVGQVFLQADTTKMLYKDLPFQEDQDPSFPVELFMDVPDGYFTIWSQSIPGGLPTNTVHQPIQEVKFTTYKLDAAVSYLAKYARQTRLPVIAKSIERLLNEVLIKTQANAWAVIFAALAQAQHNGRGHVFNSATAGQFTLDDFSSLLTFFRRLNRSFVGGTPVGGAARPTDIVISPEMMEKLRAMAYNPINTKAANGIAPTASTPSIALPEAQRADIFKNAGAPEFFGINIVELLELGQNQPYNILFDEMIGNLTLPYLNPNTAPSGTFNSATQELVLVVDASKDFAYRAIQTDSDTSSVFTLQPDDQFIQRSGKVGFYGAIQEGRVVIDTRGLVGMVV